MLKCASLVAPAPSEDYCQRFRAPGPGYAGNWKWPQTFLLAPCSRGTNETAVGFIGDLFRRLLNTVCCDVLTNRLWFQRYTSRPASLSVEGRAAPTRTPGIGNRARKHYLVAKDHSVFPSQLLATRSVRLDRQRPRVDCPQDCSGTGSAWRGLQ